VTVVLGIIFGLVIVGPPGNDAPAPLLQTNRGTAEEAATSTTEVPPPTEADATTTTRQASSDTAPPFPGQPLTSGDSGADVKSWQTQMRKRGWDIAADGQFGQGAVAVAKAFQRQKGLNPSGEVDQATWVATWTAPLPDDTTLGSRGS
jgi:peptidoglycan hydrolase-like protein with peptidoglycan-binding domain